MRFFIFILILFWNSVYSQDKSLESENIISTPIFNKCRPIDYEISDWKESITKEITSKWNLDFSQVILKFIIDTSGNISDLKIISEEWKPTEKEVLELLNIINSKGKWIAATRAGVTISSIYTIRIF